MTYTWQARYNDGTKLNQIDPDGSKHSYTDIERDKLDSFSLYNDQHEGVEPILTIVFDRDGDKLVWTRRVYMRAGQEPMIFHIVGKKGEFILAVNEFGNIIARHNFKDDGLFDSIVEK